MDNSAEHEATESDMNHCLRDVDPLLAIPNEALPTHHPTESRLDGSGPGEHLEAWLLVGAANELEAENLIGCGIHKTGAVVSTISKRMLEPEPSLANGHNLDKTASSSRL